MISKCTFILLVFLFTSNATDGNSEDSLIAFLEACVHPGDRGDSELIVSGFDDNKNRHVVMVFKVISLGDRSCELIWDHSINDDSKTRITDHITGELITSPTKPGDSTRIAINAYGTGIDSYWELNNFYPNGFVSGSFLRSFIVKAIKTHSQEFAGGKPVPLKLTDSCTLREQYWLEKGTGKTYYEGFWNLEYECLLTLSQERLLYLYDLSRTIQDLPLIEAFIHDEPTLRESSMDKREEHFRTILQDWKANKTAHQIETMTIRQMLAEFNPFWRSRIQDFDEQQEFSRILFRFLFHYTPNWELIARQVLARFYPNCYRMIGYPIDPTHRVLHFGFRKIPDAGDNPTGENDGSSDVSGFSNEFESHIMLGIDTSAFPCSHFTRAILVTFCFIIFYIIWTFHTPVDHTFDTYYSEL